MAYGFLSCTRWWLQGMHMSQRTMIDKVHHWHVRRGKSFFPQFQKPQLPTHYYPASTTGTSANFDLVSSVCYYMFASMRMPCSLHEEEAILLENKIYPTLPNDHGPHATHTQCPSFVVRERLHHSNISTYHSSYTTYWPCITLWNPALWSRSHLLGLTQA